MRLQSNPLLRRLIKSDNDFAVGAAFDARFLGVCFSRFLFFTAAAALAYRKGVRVLVGGMCETDFSGYPDCRDDTLKALQVALGLGMDRRFTIETPLMWIDKAATFKMAEELGGQPLVDIVIEHTHTCYLGNRERNEWGRGCGECPACKLRKDGYAGYNAARAARRSA